MHNRTAVRILTWALVRASVLLVMATIWPMPSVAQQPIERTFLAWARRHLHPIRTLGLGARLEELEPLRGMIGRADVVSLGEGLHGGAEPLEFRNQLFRFLAERMGFNGIALESGIVEGFTASEYVLGGPGDLETTVRQGFTDGFDKLPQESSLVKWMRAYNTGAAHPRKLHIYGIDVSTGDGKPLLPLPEALRYLDQVDPEAAAPLRARLGSLVPRLVFSRLEASPYPGLSQVQRDSATGVIADLVALFEMRQARYIEATSPRAYQLAYRTAIAARQVDNYVRRIPVGWTPRDGVAATMATGASADRSKTDNVRWVREQLGPNPRLLVFAHRDHVATAPLSLHFPPDNPFGLPPVIDYPPLMGTYLGALYGKRLVTIGNLLAEDRSQCGTPLAPAEAGTLEALLAELGVPLFLLDLRTAPKEVRAWLDRRRTLYGLRFADALEVGKGFDIILFSKTVGPAIPCS